MQILIHSLVSLAERRSNSVLVIVALGVILCGAVYSADLGDRIRYGDEREYYALAKNLVSHHEYTYDGLHPTAFRPPGYSFGLSSLLFFGARIVHLRIANFVALAICLFLLHTLLARESSRLSASLAIVMTACYPVLFYTAGTLFPQTLASLLFLAALLLTTGENVSSRRLLLGGVVFGGLILTIPTFIFALVIIPLSFWLCNNKRNAKRFILVIATASVLVGVWCARNYAVFGDFVFISNNSGLMLLLGNSENTTPNVGTNADISKYKAETAGFGEVERNRYYRKRAMQFMGANVFRTSKMYCLKFLNYFNWRNDLAVKEEARNWRDAVMLLSYGPLLAIFVCRLILIRRFKPLEFEALLIALYLASALFYAIFFTRIRYRLPFDFLLIAIDAMFISRLYVEKVRPTPSSGFSKKSLRHQPVRSRF